MWRERRSCRRVKDINTQFQRIDHIVPYRFRYLPMLRPEINGDQALHISAKPNHCSRVRQPVFSWILKTGFHPYQPEIFVFYRNDFASRKKSPMVVIQNSWDEG